MAKKSETKRADPKRHIVEAAMDLAAERGWRSLSLADIAEAADMTLAELRRHVASKPAILAAVTDLADAAVLDAGPSDGATARERLFEIVMRRFEALQPYKDGLAAAMRDGTDPVSAICGGARLLRSMSWMLEAAGIRSAGLSGLARTQGLAGIYAATMPVWMRDESEDLGRTMASLDRRLARAESLATLCGGRVRRARPDEAEPAGEPSTA